MGTQLIFLNMQNGDAAHFRFSSSFSLFEDKRIAFIEFRCPLSIFHYPLNHTLIPLCASALDAARIASHSSTVISASRAWLPL